MGTRGTARAGIYARISLDRQDGEGVARQVADCRALAAELGWEVVEEYVDNDVSAYSGKARPAYRRMIHDLETGRIGAILSYHTDRLYRQRKDLAEFVDVVKATDAQVRTVKAGEVELSTASGRLIAAQLGAIGIYESERMGERVSRAKRERALQGRPPGGGLRPFGYADDKVTLVPAEADLIRESARRVATGGSLRAECIAWNAAGITTTAGNPWEVTSLRRVLMSPRIAGVRTYKGEEIGPAAWPPIIDRDTFDRLQIIVQGRRRGRAKSDEWLLTTLIRCPACGYPMYGANRSRAKAYICHPSPNTGRNCGKASVSASAADRRVLEVVGGWLRDPPPGLLRWLNDDPAPPEGHQDEVTAIIAARKELTRRYAEGELALDEYDEARAVLTRRLDAIDAMAPQARPTITLDDLLAAWDRAEVPERRSVIEALVACPMPLASSPPRSELHHVDPGDRLTVAPRWEV